MRLICLIAVVVTCVSPIFGEPTTQPSDDAVQQWLHDAAKAKAERLKSLRQELAADRRQHDIRGANEAQSEISFINRMQPYLPELVRLEIGEMGRLDRKLVMDSGDTWHEAPLGHGLVEVAQVIDEQNSLVYAPIADELSRRALVWMTGFPHQKADGQTVDTGMTVFWIAGRKQYSTAGGATKTVYVIQPVDITKYAKKTR